MTQTITPSHLRSDLFNVLDQILETGNPVVIKRKGSLLQISRSDSSKLKLLKPHPDAMSGNPDEISGMDWSSEWNHDLP